MKNKLRAMFLDLKSYKKMHATTIGLLKLVSQAEKDIAERRVVDQNNFFSQIEERFKK